MSDSAGKPSTNLNESPPSPDFSNSVDSIQGSPAPEGSSESPPPPPTPNESPPPPLSSPPPPSTSPPPPKSESPPPPQPSSPPPSQPLTSASPSSPPPSQPLTSASPPEASPEVLPPPMSDSSPPTMSNLGFPPPLSSQDSVALTSTLPSLSEDSNSITSPPPPTNSLPLTQQTLGSTTPPNTSSLGNSLTFLPPLASYPPPGTPPQSSNSGPSTVNGAPKENSSPTTTALASNKAVNGTSNMDYNSTANTVSVVLGGVFIIAFLSVFFMAKRRKKQADHYYHGRKPLIGSADPFYAMRPQNPTMRNIYGSQRLQLYQGGDHDSGVIGSSMSFFSYDEVLEITNGFARENVIGEGGFGCVYKGSLPDGKLVAVKQLKAGSGQGEREFRAEVEIISRVHHRHLVSLVGYCIAEYQRLLIYEFVPNKTLEHHLHGKGLPVLDWTKRVKIALGAARGLAYLHEDCHPKIIHRDIKSANILLDDAFESQVADFGLAKLTNDTHTHVSTRVMGTFGYMAPEYASSGKLTDRSDVFSFGVVLLELVTGRKPVDPTQPLGDESLVEWARPLLICALETGNFSELVDPRLGNRYVESELVRMIEAAAACIRHSAPKRPRMAKVIRALDNEGEMSDLTNGVKFGQSIAYDSGLYNQDIMELQRMVLNNEDSLEFDMLSGKYHSHTQSSWMSHGISSGFPSGESETRAMNAYGGKH